METFPQAPRNSRTDVYHSTYFTPCPVSGLPVVVTVHDLIAEKFSVYVGSEGPEIDRKRRAILSATLCIAVSAATATDPKKFYPTVADRVRIVHLGAEHLVAHAQRRQTATGRSQRALRRTLWDPDTTTRTSQRCCMRWAKRRGRRSSDCTWLGRRYVTASGISLTF